MISNKSILVTGMPRSGTSWAGRMIGQVPFIRYIHEPFNISGYPCHCGVSFDYWFYYISPENSQKFNEHLKHIIYPAYKWVGFLNLITELWKNQHVRPLANYLQSYLFHKPLVKDPIAVFSTGTLANQFHMDVLVLIRHPAAIINSYKALNWTHSFSHFLNQTELMEKHLAPFRTEIEDFVKNEYDIIDQAALLWKLIHYMIIKYQETQPEWVFVRHEDLAVDPIKGYQKVFDKFGLPFSIHTRNAIQTHSLREEQTNITDPYAIKQNPNLVVSHWKKKLTSAEVDRIRRRVEDVSSNFYSDAEWKL